MSIAANKHKGIRASVCGDAYSAKLTRNHNDANVLCMGARVISEELALQLVDAFVDAEFEGGVHADRVAAVMAFEND
jgi:ribose 5-phosphate isomerase B